MGLGIIFILLGLILFVALVAITANSNRLDMYPIFVALFISVFIIIFGVICILSECAVIPEVQAPTIA